MILVTVAALTGTLVVLFMMSVTTGLIGSVALALAFLLRPVRRFATRFTQSATYQVKP